MPKPPSNPSAPKTGAAYFGNRFLAHGRRDLDVLARSCDYVVHTLSETDFYFHKAALGRLFAATRRRGLEVWADPWGLGGFFGGEALSKFLLDHPDHWQTLSDGKRVPAACPRSPAFRDFMKEWILTAADLGAQWVFWDEPHVHFRWGLEWEGVYACACPRCGGLFRAETGRPLPARLDDAAREFRRRSLRGLLRELMAYARKKGLRNALCLYAFDGYGEYERIWDELSSLPELDVFGCDPYWRWPPRRRDPAAHVRRWAEKTRAAAALTGKGSQIWIQAMRLPRGAEPEIVRACRAAAQAGVTHLAAWSYDGGALLDPVLAEEPDRVWSSVETAFAKVRKT